MNVLEIVRAQKKREEAVKAAQKVLCYRGVKYTKQASNIIA